MTVQPTMMKWKWATTKYVSCTWMSTASVARKTPVSPPIVNSPRKPSAYSIGASNEIEPRCRVAIQLKTFTAEGIATRNESSEKTTPAYSDWPLTNMWWPHTRNPSTAIARLEKATNV